MTGPLLDRAAVSVQLGISALVDPLTIALAIGAGVALILLRVSSMVLVVVGGLVGLAAAVIGTGP